MLDPEKAELLRAKLPDSTSGQSNDSKGSLADVVVAADAPGITAEGPQPQNDSSGAVPTKSDPPVQAIIHAAGLKPDSQTASASDPIVMTHGKKRKADKPCTNTAADTDPDAFLDDQEQDIGGHDASVSHAQDESTQPKQARARVGCSKRPRPGTLQAAFAKAKVRFLTCCSTVATVLEGLLQIVFVPLHTTIGRKLGSKSHIRHCRQSRLHAVYLTMGKLCKGQAF